MQQHYLNITFHSEGLVFKVKFILLLLQANDCTFHALMMEKYRISRHRLQMHEHKISTQSAPAHHSGSQPFSVLGPADRWSPWRRAQFVGTGPEMKNRGSKGMWNKKCTSKIMVAESEIQLKLFQMLQSLQWLIRTLKVSLNKLKT